MRFLLLLLAGVFVYGFGVALLGLERASLWAAVAVVLGVLGAASWAGRRLPEPEPEGCDPW